MSEIELATRAFNRLTSKAAFEAAECVRSSVVPVFAVDSKENPAFEGSGVLLSVGSRFFLLSAAHVLQSLTQGVHLLIEGSEQSPLRTMARVSSVMRQSERYKDKVDAGFVELTREEAAGIGFDSFLDVRHLSFAKSTRRLDRYFVLGYPHRDQERSDPELVYRVNQSYYIAPELKDDGYKRSDLDSRSNLLLQFDKRRIRTPKGTGSRPDFVGMSGGGIWKFDPFSTYAPDRRPLLVAILLGPAPKNGKALFGIRVRALLRMITTTHPDLLSVIPSAARLHSSL